MLGELSSCWVSSSVSSVRDSLGIGSNPLNGKICLALSVRHLCVLTFEVTPYFLWEHA